MICQALGGSTIQEVSVQSIKKQFQVLERANKFVAIFRWPTTLYVRK